MAGAERNYQPIRFFPATASDPMLARIATLLQEKGIDPAAAVLADYFQDDSSLMFGLVVSPDRRVFQFDYDYLHVAPDAGTFSKWVDLTDSWQTGIYSTPIQGALKMVGSAT